MNPVVSRIEQIRKANGLNQSRFSERIAINQSYYSKIIKGDRELNDRLVKLVCSEFNVDERWLRTGVGEPTVPPPSGPSDVEILERYVLNALRQLSPEYRAYFQSICEKFLEEQNARKADD